MKIKPIYIFVILAITVFIYLYFRFENTQNFPPYIDRISNVDKINTDTLSNIFNSNNSIDFNEIINQNNNSINKYTSRIIAFNSNTTEGGEIKVYFDNDTYDTKILKVSISGETFRRLYEYYFDDISNFVLIERNEKWNAPFYIDDRIKTEDITYKYYFKDLNMISWINDKNKSADKESDIYKSRENTLLTELEYYLSKVDRE